MTKKIRTVLNALIIMVIIFSAMSALDKARLLLWSSRVFQSSAAAFGTTGILLEIKAHELVKGAAL